MSVVVNCAANICEIQKNFKKLEHEEKLFPYLGTNKQKAEHSTCKPLI